MSKAVEHPESWYLKKHEDSQVFGPVRFAQLLAWASAAQVNPRDMVSTDGTTWNKAPMIAELCMDWLIELSESLLYGPTTSSALMEFARLGEIARNALIVNCRTGEVVTLEAASFFSEASFRPAVGEVTTVHPARGGVKISLQKRIRDLEALLMEKQLELHISHDALAKLETRVRELEHALHSTTGSKR